MLCRINEVPAHFDSGANWPQTSTNLPAGMDPSSLRLRSNYNHPPLNPARRKPSLI